MHFGAVAKPPLHKPPLACARRYRAVPCRAVPCRAVPCRAVPCRAVPYPTVPYRTVPYHTAIRYNTVYCADTTLYVWSGVGLLPRAFPFISSLRRRIPRLPAARKIFDIVKIHPQALRARGGHRQKGIRLSGYTYDSTSYYIGS